MIQNKHLHPNNPMEADCMQLQATVQQISYDIQQEPQLNNTLQYMTPDQIMTKTINRYVKGFPVATTTWAANEKQQRLGPNYTTPTYDSTSLKNISPNQVQQTKTSSGHPKE